MKQILHLGKERGHANFGWLDSYHSFSFGNYFHPEKIQFGALRVLNDDTVESGMGFGTHPHDNMEIVSIPLSGELAHKDSTGTNGVIQTGEVQIMSAGSGIRHSEFNHSLKDKVNFLQIWILPKERNISPRYEQKAFAKEGKLNSFQTIVSPNHSGAVWINQEAHFSLTILEEGKELDYELKNPNHGLYVFLINGKLNAENQSLEKRDAVGFWETKQVHFKAEKESEFLVIEVPMR
ncbi:pirin family protein [Leptospira ilyithenensis]|uniref:Pirin family protein n=1 Tax=Leptospira ilyithenensis TaxID=2484901 RepID=A0A4V3JXP3_9LEPT|nr:pirin family protein [Leptospira ilyithenensis]TGN14579.1 pirin family protein [Leptospira ilyithenensis]